MIGSRAEIELQRYRSRMAPKAVLHTLAAWEVRFDLAIYYFPTAEAASGSPLRLTTIGRRRCFEIVVVPIFNL